MVKILNPSTKKGFRGTEQYNDCSSMLKASDDPSLDELDPAILSLGLPAIMLADIPPRMVVPPPRIRYSPGQLQAIRKSTLSFRRPAIVDDARVQQFPIWKPAPTTSNQPSRGRGCRPYVSPHSEPKDDDDKGSHTKDKPLERTNAQQKLYHGNGIVAPRFRRNFEFSNRNQHAIVRSHAGGDNGNNGHQETATVEDEPEWMAAGPTSRLDTIELRGFDDDISPNASLDKAPSNNSNNSSDPKLSCASNISTSTSHAEKHVSFYDDLPHYEHVHPQKQQRGGSQGRDDVESVATSTASSPPARSTPTKRGLGGEPNANDDKLEAGGNQKQKSPQLPHNGINVHNFEQFMKFESFLGPDTSSNDQTASRFTKWFRRNSSGQGQPPSGSTYDGHYQAQEGSVDFGSGYDIRYQLERIHQQQQQQNQQHPTSSIPRGGFHSQQPQNRPQNDIPTNGAFRRLIDMLAINYAKNDLIAQQQYLLEVLNRGQQNENLRRMLLQNPTAPDSSVLQQQTVPQQQQQQQQRQRIPSQRELQCHTQTIMQNALLRKKLQDQRKLLQNQNSQMAAAAAVAAGEPSPLVQQFVQSVCPNLQRSLSVLNQTAASVGPQSNAAVSSSRQQQQLLQGLQQFPGVGSTPRADASLNSPMFSGGPSHAELSASLQQMLKSPPSQTQQSSAQPKPARPQLNQGLQSGRGGAQQTQPSQQQQQQQPAQRSGRRFGKGSVTWSNVHLPRP